MPPPMKGSATVRPGKSFAVKEALREGPVAEFSEREAAKQRAGPPGEPFVDGDDWTVVLLNLLLAAGHLRDQGDVEEGFDGHCVCLARRRAQL